MVALSNTKDRIIVALDCDGREALALAHSLQGIVGWMKIGMTLFYEEGPSIVARVRDLGYEVFLDLKMHDIPHQVHSASRSIARLGVGMMTVHASGGSQMVSAACDGVTMGARDAGVARPAVLAVTVLTSINDSMLAAVGVPSKAAEQVPLLARVAHAACADGIVCSPLETELVRRVIGPEPLLVTPGVRPGWCEKGDQQRVLTPLEAVRSGASHLVIGRPITAAAVPAHAAQRIIDEIEEGLTHG